MKRIVTIAAATLMLAGALALTACGPRADGVGAGRGAATTEPGATPSAGQPGSGPSAGAAGGTSAAHTGAADADLAQVDAVLNGVDSDLAAADKAPDDAD